MRRRWGLVVAAAVVLLVTGGCGAAGRANPEKVGPRGVDELVIPTPSPDPGDFVDGVDNPWLPLAPGTVWTYDVTGGPATRLEVRVEPRREVVAGVSCVVVRRVGTDEGGRTVEESTAFYAQDTRGNVWTLGATGTRAWRAGADGAEAGLAMPATPRVGDGFLQERAPGVVADASTVLSLTTERTVPAGTFGGLLLLEDAATIGGPLTVQRAYAAGTGLVQSVTTVGGVTRTELVGVQGP